MKREGNGEGKKIHVKNERQKETHTLKLCNMYSECQEYKEERQNFESEMIRIGNREW